MAETKNADKQIYDEKSPLNTEVLVLFDGSREYGEVLRLLRKKEKRRIAEDESSRIVMITLGIVILGGLAVGVIYTIVRKIQE